MNNDIANLAPPATIGMPSKPQPEPKKHWRTRLAKGMPRGWTMRAAIVACACSIGYWGFVASDRYVSESHILIQRTDMAGTQSLDLGSLLSGSSNASRNDQLLLRDYLRSPDMLARLDAKLNLRQHYSNASVDLFSRMWSSDAPAERFHRYFLSRVSIEYDDFSGVLVVKAQGFDPATAQAITTLMVQEGERNMNALAHRLAQDQGEFVSRRVAQMAEKFQQARLAVIAYQNKKGMASPQSTAENINAIINRLDGERITLQAQRNAALGYLAPQAPGVIELNVQIAAVDKQIAQEKARLTAVDGAPLNSTVEEYQRLEMAAAFAQDVYKSGLVALEKSEVEATRNLKKMTALQVPNLPQESIEPRRYYNMLLSVLTTLLIAGVIQLLSAIVRDHKD